MNGLHHHIHHHAKKVVHHVRAHHKKYLFAGSMVAAFFAITKVLVFFATSFALFASSHDTSFADELALDPLVQEVSTDTGTVLEETGLSDEELATLGLIDSGAVATGDTETLSGDSVIDSGTLLYLMSLAATQSDFSTGTDMTGSVNTGMVSSGTVVSGSVLANNTGESLVDSGNYYQTLLANQVVYCHTGNLHMSTEFSGKSFTDIIPFQWTFENDCIAENLSFQLYDHNKQWIEITTLSGSNVGFSFDSNFLSTGAWYATTGINASGQIYTIDPGLYSGVVSSYRTGYQVRIINENGFVLYQSSGFTIDNLAPKLTGFVFKYYTGSNMDGEVHFLFSGSEELENISISLTTGKTSSKTVSGTAYDYYLRGFGTGFVGSIGYTISFSDILGNTGSVSGTGYLNFSGTTLESNIFTGTFSALLAMKREIANFNACKENLKYKSLNLDISNKEFNLIMPEFKKSEVKKLVSAFSYFVVKKLDSVDSLSQNELDEITKTYNNFLVVLKLVKDDENECTQNLGNYYMGLFATTMANYGITEL